MQKGHRRSVAVFTTEFPPTPVVGALRLGKLCSYLPELGWDPTVFTVGAGSHTVGRNPADDRPLRPLTYPVSSSVGVVRLDAPNPLVIGSRLRRGVAARSGVIGPPAHGGHLGDRPTVHGRLAWNLTRVLVPDEYALWIPRAISAATRIAKERPFDLVWASFPWASAVVAAVAVARRMTVPMVLDFRDSWGTWHPLTQAPGWRKRVERRIEARAFRQASAVTSVNDAMSADLRTRHPSFVGPIATLPQGWDPAERRTLRHIAPLSARDGVMRITYGGIVRPDVSHPGSLFAALAILKRRALIDPSRLDLTFLGNHLIDLKQLAAEHDIADIVSTVPHCERGAALRKFAESDALLMINSRQDVDWLTGKVWDYLTVDRKILAVGFPGSAAADLLATTGAGERLPIDDVESIVTRMGDLWAHFDQTGALIHAPDPEILERFSMTSVATVATTMFDELVGSRP